MTAVALVTGASRGIGSAIASRLTDQGLFVVGTATGEAGIEKINSDLGESGAGAQLNLEDSKSISELLDWLSNEGYQVSVLVNNAGVTRDNLLMRMSVDDWLDVVNVNLNALYSLTKPLIRQMIRARSGRIINVSSVVARSGNPGQTNYVTTKAGIEGFTRSLALELASRKVTVNCVAPGYISTDMTAVLSEKANAAMIERIPLGRQGEPQEVAAMVGFLASSDAGYITGQTFHVNGGLYLA